LDIEGRKPFETKSGDVYPSEGGVPNFDKPLWEMPRAEKPMVFDIEGSYKNPDTGTYWTFDKNTGKPRDLEIPYDKNEGRSTTVNNNSPNQEPTTPYVNFDSVDEEIRNYNKRTKDGVAVGDKIVPVDVWRTQVNEKLEKNLRDAGISQEVSDKIWELAGINSNDDAVTKRKKLKNVLDQQTQLPDFQRRALYQMVEVRTR
jgi:cytochrome c biogenesis protein ResB